ncbi:SCO7613 C-terminal domain-containing membrane protein [Catenulispora subtropica]|uniref:SCO7613 C-terminal domain-containing membrane protein n=1 Tax=Catenulispora subtropica TaxID=450798 RepID=UPI0031D66941
MTGLTAARLWVVDQSIAALTAERTMLLRALRGASVPAMAPAVPSPAAPTLPAHYLPAPRPRVEWSRRKVQNLLLGLGVLLLTVAALIFVAVNWGTLGAGGRAAVMALVTVSAGGAATAAAHRGLPATAESVAGLAIALLVVDAFGLRLTGFATGISATTYSGAVVAVIAISTAAWSTAVNLRTLRICALLAAQLVIPLLAETSVGHPASAAAVYGLQTIALLALRYRTPIAEHVDAKVLRISTYAWWAFALIACAAAVYGRSPERSAWGYAEFAACAAIAVWAARHEDAEIHLAVATATGIAAACGIVPHLAAPWRAPVVEIAAMLAAAAVLLAVPTHVARASNAVVAATAGGALLTAVKPTGQALAAPFALTAQDVWHSTWSQASHLASTHTLAAGQRWAGTGQLALLVLAALVTALFLIPKSVGLAHQTIEPALAALVLANLVLVPLEAAWVLPAAVAWDLALGVALLLLATARRPESHRVMTIVGACFLVHGAVWSVRSATLTVVAVAVVAATTAMAAARWRSRDRLVLAAAAAGLAVLEAVLIGRYQGTTIAGTGVVLAAAAAGLFAFTYVVHKRLDDLYTEVFQTIALVAAVISLGLAAGEPAASTMAVAFLIAGVGPGIGFGKGRLTLAWLPLVQVLLCLEVDTIHRWLAPEADLSSRGVALAIAAAVVTVAVHRLTSQKTGIGTLITGPAVYVLALAGTVAGLRLDPIWIALLVGGVAAGVVAAVRPPRAVPGAVSSLLVLASSWVRLGESHVHTVEPYTVPAALTLLVAGYFRRREASSWSCYGLGLILGLTPTLAQALTDPGLLRPALVGLAALMVLIAGMKERLQAPLAIGGGVLAVDAIAQLSPYLADAYNAVPRWALIAAAGALLLILGVTYERRIRDLRTLGRRFGGLR